MACSCVWNGLNWKGIIDMQMQMRKLGKTDLEVSAVAMGCWAIAGDSTWGSQDENDAYAAMGTALDEGINFFDTAAGYGESETMLGKGLGDRRSEAIIASKVSREQLRPDLLIESCENSLKALGTDYIDLFQIHWPSREVPLADSVAALEKLQEDGKIRYYGVSNFGPLDLADLLKTNAVCASNQVIYSMLTRAIEFEVQPICVREQISILAYSPLAQALLTGKFHSADEVSDGRARTRHFSGSRPQARHGEAGCEAETFAAIDKVRAIAAREGIPMGELSLTWCLQQPGVTSVLAGARNPEQARANAASGRRVLSPELLAELSAVTDEVKVALGPSIDLWQGTSGDRVR
jgi:aryl-alcohol dehydrogenase-like predicted oxidoreductase